MTLTATVREVDPSVDLVGFAGETGTVFEHGDDGLAGRGVALVVDLPGGLADAAAPGAVARALASIEVCGDPGIPGTGPVAVGALPFDPHAPTRLVVPAVCVRRAGGRAWCTEVGLDRSAGDPIDEPRGQPPDRFALVPGLPHAEWCSLVDKALGEIESGRLDKVVVAREVRVEANRPIVRSDVLARLRALYPGCTLFAVDGFVGASPELLVGRNGTEVRSQPLAGTVARSGDAEVDARLAERLLASPKQRGEHALVVDAVAAALAPVCTALEVPATPSLVSLRNVTHLATAIRGRLRHPPPDALELVRLVHPTPAVAGVPVEAACAWLRESEGFDRGRFAGPVGWVDRRGDGRFVVGIRSAELDGAVARLFAGVGVVAGSVPEDELAETQLKLQALLAAIVRP